MKAFDKSWINHEKDNYIAFVLQYHCDCFVRLNNNDDSGFCMGVSVSSPRAFNHSLYLHSVKIVHDKAYQECIINVFQ